MTEFFAYKGPHSIQYIADSVGAKLKAPPTNMEAEKVMIDFIANIEDADANCLSFISNSKYENLIHTTKAGCCIVSPSLAESYNGDVWLMVHDNPYYAYALAVDLFYEDLAPKSAIAATAVIDPTAVIGKNCRIGDHCYIGPYVQIGDNARIDSNVTISNAIIGNDVVILPGARIGQDGYGFATHAGRHKKIFHIGKVIIGNDVEIGANTCIDRGSLRDTVISNGVRIDNLVQLGHNVKIGTSSIIVAQVGVAGSTEVGNYCALGGQVGIAGHLRIADSVQLAGQAGVIQNIEQKGIYGGTPAVPIRDWHKQSIILRKLTLNKV